jgi:hypothetical protein
MHYLKKFCGTRLASLVLVATVPSTAAHANERDWDRASTLGATGLTLIAIGVPIIENDDPGMYQAGGSILAAQAITLGLKTSFPENRPDLSGNGSFPSGHTAQAFAAATTLYRRQGSSVGIPAYLVAGFVGTARIKAKKHYWYDVLAGAAIGTGTGILLTNIPQNQQIAFIPWGDSHGGGVSIAMRF